MEIRQIIVHISCIGASCEKIISSGGLFPIFQWTKNAVPIIGIFLRLEL